MNTNRRNKQIMMIFPFLLFLISITHAKPLQFELSVADFYNPLFSEQENKEIQTRIIDEKIQITGIYEASRDLRGVDKDIEYKRNCPRIGPCMPFSGTWSIYRAENEERAKIIAYDPQQQTVTFELPPPLKTLIRANKLKEIKAFSPDTNIWVTIPYSQKNTYYKKIENSKTRPLKQVGVVADKNSSHVAVAEQGIIVLLSTLPKRKPQQTSKDSVLSNEEKKQFFDHLHLIYHSDSDFVALVIPPTLPDWYGLAKEQDRDYKKTKGLFLKNRQFEAIRLKGSIPFDDRGRSDSFNKEEVWLKNNGRLTHVFNDPVHSDPGKRCELVYGVLFYPDGSEQRYFATDLSAAERLDEAKLDKKKIIVSAYDLTPLLKFEPNISARPDNRKPEAVACQRAFTDAKRVLGASREQLEQEFNAYRAIIETAQKNKTP